MLPYGETVTRLRATAVLDPYSQRETGEDWSAPDELEIPGCAFDPGGSLESAEVGREPVVSTPTLYAPVDADVTARDRVIMRGRTWLVDGDPAEYRSPFSGWAPGLVVKLKAVTG